ncbi:MAG TPA: XRE family transcriptional regulator [Solirubrobacteraceae bacterium]|nr:XRE family transcriptional regulator [Solirubrobacteraceae bacterium]
MDESDRDHVAALAVNLRRLREAHHLSLGQLAERSGIAKATLIKIERERTNPTLDTLAALAGVFSVEIGDLITNVRGPQVEVVRAGDGLDVSDDAGIGRILKRHLAGSTLVEIHDTRFKAGRSEISISHGAGAREHVLVRKGRIRVGPVDAQVDLGPGDYATYAADRPHRWTVTGRSDALVWIVHTSPWPAAAVV